MPTSAFRSESLLLLAAVVLGLSHAPLGFAARTKPTIDYNRDVKPILSENCYTCHGPDGGRRKAGLRLDQKEAALSELKSGERAIVPGDTSKSALIARITTTDEDDHMPPAKSGKHLSDAQIDVL